VQTRSQDRASEVAADIREQIVRGTLKPGDAMPTTAALTSTYGVAPPTMRAALRLLEAEGLLRVHRGARGGPRIEALDTSALARQAELHLRLEGADLNDLLEALQVMQPGAVRLAAERRTAAQLHAMWKIVDRARSAETMSEFSDASTDFVLLLLEASGNRAIKLFALVIGDLIRTEIHREIDDGDVADSAAWNADRFAEIVNLIELRQAEAAGALWQAHLMMTHPSMRRMKSSQKRLPRRAAR
jgi:GntR family transcriptional regulator, transcriptional repressor for pyruvate dehydrogenase complex